MFQAYHVFKLHHVTYKGAKILLCDLSFQLLEKKARRLDTFLYIRDIIHRFNSIIYKSISFSTSFHSNFLHTSQYTPFHSISREKRKDSKIRFLFLLLDFFTTARKRNTLFSFRRKTRYKKKKKKKSKWFSRRRRRALEGVALGGWTTKQNKAGKRKKERRVENNEIKKIVVLQCCLNKLLRGWKKNPPFSAKKTVHAKQVRIRAVIMEEVDR